MTDPRLQDRCFDEQGQLVSQEPVVGSDEPYLYGCANFTAYAMVPWSAVTDLKLLARPEDKGGLGIKIIERSDMSLATLREELGLNDDKDVYLMKDSTVSHMILYSFPMYGADPVSFHARDTNGTFTRMMEDR
jgi:hypothetical protein